MRPKPKLESKIVDEIRDALMEQGWTLVEKTHGTEFSAGWPDLMCFLPRGEASNLELLRHVEVKRPGRSKKTCLTPAQRSRFAKWEAAGLGVWVLTSADETPKLFGPPNWRDYA